MSSHHNEQSKLTHVSPFEIHNDRHFGEEIITFYLLCTIYDKMARSKQNILSTIPTRCNVIQYSLLLTILYMFQAVSPPIIRSSKLYIQHLVYVQFWAPDDGRRNHLKHV